MKPLHVFALCLLFIPLAACQTWEGIKRDVNEIKAPNWATPSSSARSSSTTSADLLVESGNCPTLEVVEELSTVSEFSDITEPQPYNLISSAQITGAENSCEYSGKTATVDIKLALEGQTGAKSMANTYSYPYFVAVTAPNGNILAKEVFNAPLDYNAGQTRSTTYESIRQIIPIANQNNGPRYKVLVGFQLNQDQLQYNRAIIAQRLAAEAAAAKAAASKPANVATMAVQEQAVIIEPAPTIQQQPVLSDPQEPMIDAEVVAPPPPAEPEPPSQAPIIIVPGQ